MSRLAAAGTNVIRRAVKKYVAVLAFGDPCGIRTRDLHRDRVTC